MIKYLEKEDYQEIIKDGIWIVDFYADWCGPCKMLGSILEEMNYNILKVNVDNHEDLASKYGIMSIPTIFFFKNGEIKNKVIGFIGKEEIEKIVKSLEG